MAGRIVRATPGYSGAILTATFVLTRDRRLALSGKTARQKVLQVHRGRSAENKILLGGARHADGNDYNLVLLRTTASRQGVYRKPKARR